MHKGRFIKDIVVAIVTVIVTPALTLLAPQAAANDRERLALEEVMVTAQKREQSIQDTPIAISVMNSIQLELQGISDLKAFENGAIPSLRVVPVGNTPSNLIVAIRGNAPGDPSEVTREGSVAIYLDGVYIARSHGLGMELADLERIEVLRGPQGSLFGRNAIGGAVSLVSKQPTGEFGIKQTIGIGRYDELRSVTRLNLPALAGINAKLDYLHAERDGWVNNTAPGEADYTEYDKDGGRLSLYWPVNDSLTFDYSYDQSNVKTAQNYFQFYKDNIGFFGEERDRHSETRLPITPLAPTESDHKGHRLTINWAQSEQLTFKSISAYRNLKENSRNNYAGVLYFNGLNDASIMEQDQYSQEFQLIGSHDQVNWVAGVYYFEEDLSKTLQDSFTLDIFNVFGNGFLSPINPPTTFDALVSGTFLPPRIVTAESRSTAIYSQASWNPAALNEALHLTLGGRYTRDEKSATRFEVGLNESDQDSDNVDLSVAITYEWNDNLSTYLKWATAYKAGGVNTRSLSFSPYQEELAATIELGLKSEFRDRRIRFNAVLFSTDYDDMQLDFTDPVVVTTVETINAAETVEVSGMEADLALSPLAGLTVGLNYTLLDADMPLQPNPLAGNALTRFFVPLLPRHAGAVTVNYRFERWRYGSLVAHLDMTSTDDYSYVPFGEQRTDAYTLFNARLMLTDIIIGQQKGALKASLWGKNLMDKEYIAYAFPVGEPAVSIGQAFGDPRTVGFDITYEL